MDNKDYKLWEQETTQTYNQLDDTAIIYTHDKALQKHIETKLGIKPHMKNGSAREYMIPKTWLRKPQKPSEKRREASRKALQARGGRVGKSKVLASA